VIFVTATTGQGDPPANMKVLYLVIPRCLLSELCISRSNCKLFLNCQNLVISWSLTL